MFKKLIVSKALRQRITLAIAVIIVLPFVIFFSGGWRGPSKGPGGSAGLLFGRRIPWETFQEERAWLRHQMGERLDTFGPFLNQLIWERLMLLAEAQRQRLGVSDVELASFIQRLPAFQDNGRFFPERYRRYVGALGTTPRAFEELLRHDLLIEKLLNSVRSAVFVTDDDVKAAYVAAHERLKASLILVAPSSFTQEVATGVTEDAIRSEYEAHPDEVRIPEQLVVEYAGASREALLPQIQPSDKDLATFYEDHRQEFTHPDGTTQPLEEARDAVRRRLQEERLHKQLTALSLDLQDDLESKLSFEEIVKTRALIVHQAGPLAADNVWSAGELDPEILQAIGGLREGEMSGVIQSDHGVYLARVTKRIPSRLPALEEVREQIRQRLIATRSRDAARDRAKMVRAELQEQLTAGHSFEDATTAVGVSIAQPTSFTRTDPIDPLGAAPAVNAAAFAAPMGQLTDVLETPSHFVMVMVHERIPPDEAAFTAEEHEKLHQQVLSERQQTHIVQWLAELRSRAKLQSFVEDTTEPQNSTEPQRNF